MRKCQVEKCVLYISLWSLCVAGASALLLSQQNNPSYTTNLLKLSMLPIEGMQYKHLQSTEENFKSTETDYYGLLDHNGNPPKYFQNQKLDGRNLSDRIIYSQEIDEFPNDLDKTFGARSKRKLAKNIQVFHLLGIYSRSINQAKRRRQQQQQKEQEKANLTRKFTINKAHRASNVLQALAYTNGKSDSTQQDRIEGKPTLEDNKRTIFVSKGWAPSGGLESDYQNRKANAKEKSIPNANMYAFTSNHWGPLGKRGDPINKLSHIKAQTFNIFHKQF